MLKLLKIIFVITLLYFISCLPCLLPFPLHFKVFTCNTASNDRSLEFKAVCLRFFTYSLYVIINHKFYLQSMPCNRKHLKLRMTFALIRQGLKCIKIHMYTHICIHMLPNRDYIYAMFSALLLTCHIVFQKCLVLFMSLIFLKWIFMSRTTAAHFSCIFYYILFFSAQHP